VAINAGKRTSATIDKDNKLGVGTAIVDRRYRENQMLSRSFTCRSEVFPQLKGDAWLPFTGRKQLVPYLWYHER
jgi:hypothetical protein